MPSAGSSTPGTTAASHSCGPRRPTRSWPTVNLVGSSGGAPPRGMDLLTWAIMDYQVGNGPRVDAGTESRWCVSSARPSNRACGSPAHGSPTSFTAGIRLLPPGPVRPGGDNGSIQVDQAQLIG